jgi:galactonate dehydratase
MKITQVETIGVNRYLLVKIHTDEGIVGLGESGAWGYLEASEQVIQKFARYLQGQDPRTIEHHWQYMVRAFYFRGAAIMGAVSAIDIALWDIKAKALGVPIHSLLGGPTRHKVRVYQDVGGKTIDAVVEDILRAKALGFTAVGHCSPLVDGPKEEVYFRTHSHRINDAVEAVRRYREAVGDEVDLCLELHRRMQPGEAIELCRAVEQYHPLFVEDPLRPDNLDAQGRVAEQVGVTLATGERLNSPEEFAMLINRRGCEIIRPSIGLCGGFTGTRKICAMAEANGIGVSFHHVASPVLLSAYVQMSAAIPNHVISEYQYKIREAPRGEMTDTLPRYDGAGFLEVPMRPGLGVELLPDAAERFPYDSRNILARLNTDGSVSDF